MLGFSLAVKIGNVKLYMMVLIELYLFIPVCVIWLSWALKANYRSSYLVHTAFTYLDLISRSQRCQTVGVPEFEFLSSRSGSQFGLKSSKNNSFFLISWTSEPFSTRHGIVAILECCPQGQGHSEGWNQVEIFREYLLNQSHNRGYKARLGDKPCLILYLYFVLS